MSAVVTVWLRGFKHTTIGRWRLFTRGALSISPWQLECTAVGENSLSPSCTHACASLFSFSSISLVVTIPSQHSNQVYSTNANILVTHLQEASSPVSPVALLLVHIPSAPAQNPAAAAVGAAMVAAASAASHTLARKKAASSSVAAVLFPLLVPPLLALLLLLLLLLLRLLRTQDSSSPSKRHKT